MKVLFLHLATSDGPVTAQRDSTGWHARRWLDLRASADEASIHACIAVDPVRSSRVYYSLPENGVWRSDDAGWTWQEVFRELPHSRVTALSVSPAGDDGKSTVLVGTEPSTLFMSRDGGDTWQRCQGMEELPSSSEWSFPPRPESHHVRWIQPHPVSPDRVLVAIEAGALVYSPDGGKSWQDHVPGSPFDTHQLVVDPAMPEHLLAAAGDGIYQSHDFGKTWAKTENGLPVSYGWSVALNASNPKATVLSAAKGPRPAHTPNQAEGHLFRREGNKPWEEIHAGLPDPKGSLAPVVASHDAEPGSFYAG